MSWADELWRLGRDLRNYVDQRLNLTFGWTDVSSGTSLGGDFVEQTDDAGTKQAQQRPVTRIEPFGFRGVPPKGLRQFWINWSKQGTRTISLGVQISEGYGPQDMQPGESAMYNKIPGVVLRLDKDGNIVAHVASGKLATFDDGAGAVPLALKSDVQAVVDWLKLHVHTEVTTGTGSSGPPADGLVPGTAPSDPAGTTVLEGK